jgi:hypothetical protein
MSAPFKPGDLVMVVRPTHCCGSTVFIGTVGVVGVRPLWATRADCEFCGRSDSDLDSYAEINNGAYHQSTLKKLDPPERGDFLPTRLGLELPA